MRKHFYFSFSFFSCLCCNCQQAVEDLLEDEDEDFDKDDKVIMSCVRDALTHKHIHKHMHSTHVHTHIRTLPQEVLTLLHTPETQTDEWNDSISISSPVQLFSLPEAQTHVQRLHNLLTFWKVFAVGIYMPHTSPFLPYGLLCFGLLLQFGTLSLFFPSYNTQIYVTNVVLQPCFLWTCTHIKCLVSYLGPFSAPLCPSKTASGLVQTLSGNNRWLLYCLRSFTL